jgi:hypothetical protein
MIFTHEIETFAYGIFTFRKRTGFMLTLWLNLKCGFLVLAFLVGTLIPSLCLAVSEITTCCAIR